MVLGRLGWCLTSRSRRRSIRRFRIRPGSGITGWAARTIIRSTARVGDRIAEMLPEIVQHARANRMVLGRAARYPAGEAAAAGFRGGGAGVLAEGGARPRARL